MVLLEDSVLEVIENCEDYHCTTLNSIGTSQKCGEFFLEITDLFDSKQCCRFNHALQMLLKYIDLFVKYTCLDKTKYTVNPEGTLLTRSTDLNIMMEQ
jgi:hypothetical protein